MKKQTRKEFIDLLKTQWPDVKLLITKTPLPRQCMHFAMDAFVLELSGPACDALRAQLKSLDKCGYFDFADA